MNFITLLLVVTSPGRPSADDLDVSRAGNAADEWVHFLSWMRKEGSRVHKSLRRRLVTHSGDDMYGVVAESSLRKGSIIARVPRNLWMDDQYLTNHSAHLDYASFSSISKCSNSDYWQVLYSVGLAIEAQKANSSYFAPWLEMTAPNFHKDYSMFAARNTLAFRIMDTILQGYEAEMSLLLQCVNELRSEAKVPLIDVTWDLIEMSHYFWRTRSSDNGMIPLFDMLNTAKAPDVNVVALFRDKQYLEIRALRDIPAGGELILSYCDDCDNELMLAMWNVYLEDNPNNLNTLQAVDCIALRNQSLAVLAVDSAAGIADLGWTAPRCRSVTHDLLGQRSLSCNLARLSWERCASDWGFSQRSTFATGGKAPVSDRVVQEYARMHISIGKSMFFDGNFSEAARSFQRATRLLPGNAQIYDYLRQAQYRSGDLKAAAKSRKAASHLLQQPSSQGV